MLQSYNPSNAETLLVWAIPRSFATTRRITIVFFSSGYLDVSVLQVSLPFGIPRLQRGGLPHSEIFGSQIMCISPKLIAAYHVLHRLCKPRHPPCALNYFLNEIIFIGTLCIHSQYVKELLETVLRELYFVLRPQSTYFVQVPNTLSFPLWRISESNR